MKAIDSAVLPTAPPVGCGPLIPAGITQGRNLKQQIFECIRAVGEIPRVNIAKELSVSAGSVTSLTAELIADGLIREIEVFKRDEDSGRGRPPVSLGVQPDAGFVAGLRLSDYRHTAIIIDFAGNALGQASAEADNLLHSFEEILNAAEIVLANALADAGKPIANLSAVGVGLPGLVDHRSGQVPWSPVIRERDTALREALSARIVCPVTVDNDANMVTLAELWFGAGRSLSNFATITIEHGIGMGLVLNHQIYRGAGGLGTEIGHTKVQLDGALCRCGQRGCLEAYVADYALVREAYTALNLGKSDIGLPHVVLEKLYEQAKHGNDAARAIFHRAGRYLALGLANVVNLFDPSLILLSGERMKYDYLYAEEVLTDMSNLVLQTGRPPPKVETHAWGGLVWAQGAAALALEYATAAAINK
jgi:predicted NBD/HSP70 family sugar kinase